MIDLLEQAPMDKSQEPEAITTEKNNLSYTGVILLHQLLSEFTRDEKWEITPKSAARICKEYKLKSKNELLRKEVAPINYNNRSGINANHQTVTVHYEQYQIMLPILQRESISAFDEAERRLKALETKYQSYIKK